MCFKEAAKKTRDHLLFNNMEDPAVWKMIISTIVRVLWSNDVKLARRIISSSELANDLLEIRLDVVICRDHVLLEQYFSETFLEHWNRKVGRLRTKVAQAASPNLRKQLKAKLQSARRMQSLYWKSAPRLVLTGLKVDPPGGAPLHTRNSPTAERGVLETPPSSSRRNPGGAPDVGNGAGQCTVTSAESIQGALRDHWGSVYSRFPFDADKARKLLNVYKNQQGELFEFSFLPDLSIEDVFDSIMIPRDSACGPDGIPYCAYRARSDLCSRVLFKSFGDISSEFPETDLAQFNQQFIWFAPKGPIDGDGLAVVRTAGNLRTIFGGNTDSRVLASAVSNLMTPPTLKVTPSSQRGFCKGRQLALNVVDLGVYSPVHNTEFADFLKNTWLCWGG